MTDFTGHPSALLKLNKAWWEAATVKGVLVNGWAPDTAADTYSDVSAYEVAMTGYAAGGASLGTPTVDLGLDGTAHYRADDAEWAALGPGSVSHFLLLADDGVDAYVVGHVDVSSQQPDGGAYAVRASVEGWLTDEWGA